VYDARDIAGSYVLPREAWAPHAVQDIDTTVLVGLKNGVSLEAGKTAVQRTVDTYGAPDVEDRGEYTSSLSRGVDMMLGVVYVLLALAILIALRYCEHAVALGVRAHP
jgi:putative ABC transport system permease protein